MWKYINAFDKWSRALPKRTQIIIFAVAIFGPSIFRYVFQHNSWATYTDRRYGYTLEYPAHLWKRVSYAGFPGDREIHLLLAWPAGIEITHQIAVGEVDITSPTLEEVAAYAENILKEDGIEDINDLETLDVNGVEALTRTYTSPSGREYKEVYFAQEDQGYFLRFTAVLGFYEASLKDFDHTVASFRVSGVNDP